MFNMHSATNSVSCAKKKTSCEMVARISDSSTLDALGKSVKIYFAFEFECFMFRKTHGFTCMLISTKHLSTPKSLICYAARNVPQNVFYHYSRNVTPYYRCLFAEQALQKLRIWRSRQLQKHTSRRRPTRSRSIRLALCNFYISRPVSLRAKRKPRVRYKSDVYLKYSDRRQFTARNYS